ncbi:MAG: hypothetical protein ACOCYP_02880 [Planctomycetota bacterium]
MFEVLKALFGSDGRTLLEEAWERFLSMLDAAADLLERGAPVVLAAEHDPELRDLARSTDKESNREEREIRKLLVEHLAFDPGHGIPCLVLMSVAKDAERMVDECRALLALDTELDEPVPEAYRSEVRERVQAVLEVLRRVRTVIAERDRAGALAVVEEEKPFNAAVAAVQKHILADAGIDLRRGVLTYQALAGIIRIRAHLGNIASAVVMPVHRIDFAKQRYVDEARQDLEDSGAE